MGWCDSARMSDSPPPPLPSTYVDTGGGDGTGSTGGAVGRPRTASPHTPPPPVSPQPTTAGAGAGAGGGSPKTDGKTAVVIGGFGGSNTRAVITITARNRPNSSRRKPSISISRSRTSPADSPVGSPHGSPHLSPKVMTQLIAGHSPTSTPAAAPAVTATTTTTTAGAAGTTSLVSPAARGPSPSPPPPSTSGGVGGLSAAGIPLSTSSQPHHSSGFGSSREMKHALLSGRHRLAISTPAPLDVSVPPPPAVAALKSPTKKLPSVSMRSPTGEAAAAAAQTVAPLPTTYIPPPSRQFATSPVAASVPIVRSPLSAAASSSRARTSLTIAGSGSGAGGSGNGSGNRNGGGGGGSGGGDGSGSGGVGSGKSEGKPTPPPTGPAQLQRSLFLFEPDHPFRLRCQSIISSSVFDALLIATVITNAIILALDRSEASLTGRGKSDTDRVLAGLDIFFICFFTIEFFLKSVVYGFVLAGPRSYLRGSWHLIEFVTVLIGLITLGYDNLTLIKTLRFFWLLKCIGSIRGMRLMIVSFLRSLTALSSSAVLLLYLMFIFAVIFAQFYQSRLTYRCFDATTDQVIASTVGDGPLCNPFSASAWGYQCDKLASAMQAIPSPQQPPLPVSTITGNTSSPDSLNFYCANARTNPNYGATSFDSIILSSLQIIICWSGEGWTPIMYYVGESVSKINYILFVLMMFAGYIFATHLVTAVMFITFRQQKEAEQEQKDKAATAAASAAAAALRASAATIAAAASRAGGAGGAGGNGATAPLPRSTTGLSEKRSASPVESPPLTDHLLAAGGWVCLKCCGDCFDTSDVHSPNRGVEARCCCCLNSSGSQCCAYVTEVCNDLVTHIAFERVMIVLITINTILCALEYADMNDRYRFVLDCLEYSLLSIFVGEVVIRHIALGFTGYWKSLANRMAFARGSVRCSCSS